MADLSALRATLVTLMERQRVPGLLLAVAAGSDTPDVLVVGADAVGAALDTTTVFPVASITKLATALAVLRLVQSGVLQLDLPLAEILPRAAAARPGITLRTLLCHTSGLPLDLTPG